MCLADCLAGRLVSSRRRGGPPIPALDTKHLRRIQRTKETLEQERCRRDAHYFVFESGLVTKDEHDQANPIKSLYDVPYLRVVLDCLLVAGRLKQPQDATYALAEGY